MDVLLVALGPLVFLLAVLAMMGPPPMNGHHGGYHCGETFDVEDGDWDE